MSTQDSPERAGGKRARTRERLVAAAAALVAEQGFERTSLEAVATRAGMTRGAIYGNFRNRDELFMAVAATHWRPIAPPLLPGGDLAAQLRTLAEAVIEALPARRAAAVGAASFQLYALTHPAMRARIEAANAEIYRRFAVAMRDAAPATGLPMPAEQLVRVLHALTDGLLFLLALTPALIDAAVIRAAFAALAPGAPPPLAGISD